MTKLIAYRVGQTLEMRPAAPKRIWMDESGSKNAYRCLPLSMANGYGWEFINPSKFSLEWDGGKGPKNVKIIKESGTIFPDNHFGEGTFTWHTGFLFKTEHPYGLYVTGPPNYPKPNVTPLSGIVETHWLPFTFTMNWIFTQPGRVEFSPGEVVCQIFPVDLTIFDDIQPEIRHLSEDPEFEEKYWQWNVSRVAFSTGKRQGKQSDGWQKDYFQGKYAQLNEESLCPFHAKRNEQEQENNPHKTKNNVPEFSVVSTDPYYTPEKYNSLLKKIREPKAITPMTEPPTVTTMENVLPDIHAKIQAATKLVLLFVTSHECAGEKTSIQQDLENKIQAEFPDTVEMVVMCIPENNMPFPKIQTDVLYYFAPKNQKPLFFREKHQILIELSHDVQAALKMMNEGVNYYDAKFDETTKHALLQTEEYVKNEDVSKFPSSFKMARNLAKEVWRTGKNAARGLPILVSAEVGFKRLSTCESCDRYDLQTNRCKECGCFMKAKTQLASATCPLNKWT
jgi:hypothetical protein